MIRMVRVYDVTSMIRYRDLFAMTSTVGFQLLGVILLYVAVVFHSDVVMEPAQISV